MESCSFTRPGWLAAERPRPLITEGVRGEGGTSGTRTESAFMFGYIPELYANETASTEPEADQWLRESPVGERVEGAPDARTPAPRLSPARSTTK